MNCASVSFVFDGAGETGAVVTWACGGDKIALFCIVSFTAPCLIDREHVGGFFYSNFVIVRRRIFAVH